MSKLRSLPPSLLGEPAAIRAIQAMLVGCGVQLRVVGKRGVEGRMKQGFIQMTKELSTLRWGWKSTLTLDEITQARNPHSISYGR